MLAGDLGYLPDGKLENLIKNVSEVERMLQALIRSLQNKSPR
jgi:hypothetical protein